jgi:hypothetical protein
MIFGFAVSTSSKNSLRLNLTRYELDKLFAAAAAPAAPAAIAIFTSTPTLLSTCHYLKSITSISLFWEKN